MDSHSSLTQGLTPAFHPFAFLPGGHGQTLFAALRPAPARVYRATPCHVALPDGDIVVLHDDCPDAWAQGSPVAILLHGLTGCHGSPYLVRIAGKLNERGVRTFRMDLRGCGAGWRLARRPYHAGISDDACAVLQYAIEQCAASPITLLGFSLGGNIVLKLLGELAADAPAALRGAVAVSPPIDIHECSRNLSRGWNRIYDRSFARGLVRYVKERRTHVPEFATISLAPAPRTVREFDDRFTAPLSGFAGVDDYYTRASAAPSLSQIAVPTKIITAADDPLIPVAMFRKVVLSSSTELNIVDRGGHVGFYAAASNDPDRNWLDWRIVESVVGRV